MRCRFYCNVKMPTTPVALVAKDGLMLGRHTALPLVAFFYAGSAELEVNR